MAVENGSTVRWFHSGMAGAPQLSGTTCGIIEVLDACLINGFGTAAPDGNKITVASGVATVEFSGGHDFEKHAVVEISGATPAALNDVWTVTSATSTTFAFDCPGVSDGNASGSITVKRATPGFWEKSFSGTEKAAYKSTHPDATGIFLRVEVGSNKQIAKVRGCYSMTGIDDVSEQWPTDQQQANLVWSASTSAASSIRNWALIADQQWVYFCVRSDESGGRRYSINQFGDFTPVAGGQQLGCVITGQTFSYGASPYTGTTQYRNSPINNQGCWMAGDIAGLEKLARHYGRSIQDTGITYSELGGVGPYPDPSTQGYLFYGPALVLDDSKAVRGTMPGIFGGTVGVQGIEGFAGAIDDSLLALDPTPDNPRPTLLVAFCSGASNNFVSGFDIKGPWR